MKILFAFPGHLRTVPMGEYCLNALQALGHEVEPFNFRSAWRDRLSDRFGRTDEEKRGMNGRLRARIADFRPDVFLALFGFDLSPTTLEFVRAQGVTSACWWINDPFQFDRSLQKAPFYDAVFSNSAGTLSGYRAAGVAKAEFLPTACEPSVHRPVPPRPEWRSEVCFAGDWSPLREQVMERLAARFHVRIFGPWKRKLRPDSLLHGVLHHGFFRPDEMAAMFSSADVVLNVHTWYGKYDHGVNPRLFEAATCGAFQFVDWKEEIPRLFCCETEMRCYRTIDALSEQIADALTSAEKRQAIGAAARARALAEHTYHHRMHSLLNSLGGGVDRRAAPVPSSSPTY